MHLPEYFPPLFLFTKQATSTMSVSRAMAHIRPMNQPWVEIPSWVLARPGGTTTHTRVTLTHLGLLSSGRLIECLQWNKAHLMQQEVSGWKGPNIHIKELILLV